MKLLVTAIVLPLLYAACYGQIQVQPGSKTPPLGKDTLCFRYVFFAQDTLTYRIETADSVLIFGAQPLIKKRVERIRVVCDSVTSSGNYVLKTTLIYVSEKQFANGDTTERITHPWLGRTISITIDSLGKRIAAQTLEQRVSPSPGGVFAPILFASLGESCGRQNQSWITQDTFSVVENGFPAPAVSVMNLWRVIDNVDTLNGRYAQLQYTQNALGTAVVPVDAGGSPLTTRAVINAYGKYSFDRVRHVPFHLFATAEVKLEFLFGADVAQKGTHLISTNFHLEEIRSTKSNRTLP
ncbi:MAG: hypothetical protein HQ472_07965 [Ignavibacteria bacterium]|nr:hypothetical protein [Ignavibacteria bacterium]